MQRGSPWARSKGSRPLGSLCRDAERRGFGGRGMVRSKIKKPHPKDGEKNMMGAHRPGTKNYEQNLVELKRKERGGGDFRTRPSPGPDSKKRENQKRA